MCDKDDKPRKPFDCDKGEPPKTESYKRAVPVPSPVVCPGVQEESKFELKGLVEFPQILRRIGPKHITIARLFTPSIISYTIAGLLTTIYFCDWQAVLQYLPFWNGKYKVVEEEVPFKSTYVREDTEETSEEKDPRCP